MVSSPARLLPARPPSGWTEAILGLNAAIFVSKRLQRVAFALICLAAAQLAAAGVRPPPAAAKALRVAIAAR